MPRALKASEYQALLKQIDAIYARARKESGRVLNLILTRAYWEIGKRIVTVEQKNNLRAQYGEALIGRLSNDLTKKYGTGFSPTNLKYMRQFYAAYPIRQPAGELEWTKYCILLGVKDESKRKLYEKKAATQNWSKRQLWEILSKEKLLSKGNAHRRELSPITHQLSPKLNVTRGRLYTYRLAEAVTPLAKGNVFVDCGFRDWYPAKCALKSLTKDTIVETVVSGGSFEAVKSSRAEKDLYTYRALLKELVDADTPWAEIDLGLGGVTLQKLRLRGIDAPEINTAAGRRAKRFVEKLLKPCPFIIVKTYKDQSDKYDRYLVDIFYLAGETDPQVVASEGKFLNQDLLDAGLAVRYDG